MGGIVGGSENVIGGADVQVAVLGEHMGVAAKGDANTGLGLCAAKPQAEESGSELKWLMPDSGGLITAEDAPMMETRAAPIPPPT
jgi:hypothetical protein